MLILLAALGCTDPEPVPPTPEAPPAELPESAVEAPALGPPIALPWPATTPCAEFGRVVVSGAFLERSDGTLLESRGEQKARTVPPTEFGPGLLIRPDLERVHITGSCADPRDQVTWVCTSESGCALEQKRIAQAPALPPALADLDAEALAASVPSATQARGMEPLVRAGIAHTLTLLRACQAQGCQSAELIERVSAWEAELPPVEVLDTTPWKLVYKAEASQLQFSCQPHACTLRSTGEVAFRLDLGRDTQSLFTYPGRLDYRDEAKGPRVAFSGRLLPLRPAQAE